MNTPSWIDSLIDQLAPPEYAEEIRGDLYELFIGDVQRCGLPAARRRYIFNACGFVLKNFFWKRSTTLNPPIMLQNYFGMARRALMAHKSTSVINIIGLLTGIAAALVLFTLIRYEQSFDTFHSHAARIYRIVRVSGEDLSEFRSGVSFPVHRQMREDISALEHVVALEYFGGAHVDVLDAGGASERKFREEAGFALAEPHVFSLLDFNGTGFRWIHGNADKALLEPFDMVLTRTMAAKYFGDENPVGRTIRLQQEFDCKVTGVIEDLPANTDFPFTVLLSYASVKTLAGEEFYNSWWGVNDSHQVYVMLREGASPADVERQIYELHSRHTSAEFAKFRQYKLQPLSELHHDARFHNFNERTISHETLLGLRVMAIFLLLTGVINYINLSTAHSVLRAREIGLRKVMGSSRCQVVLQFFAETFVIVLLSAGLAVLVSEVMLANIQTWLDIRLNGVQFADPAFLATLVIIVVSVTSLAAFYPSLVMSRFNPVTALKNRFNVTSGGVNMRKVLVVVQFTITQALVVGTFIVVSQMRYFRNVNMGFNKEGIITMRLPHQDRSRLDVLEDKLRSQAYVADVSMSSTIPSGLRRNRSYADIGRPEAKGLHDYIVFEWVAADTAYLDLYRIPLLAGRNLRRSDSLKNVVINKAIVRNLQLGTPDEAVGQQIKISDERLLTVVGVIDDYYSNSMKEGADNVILFYERGDFSNLSVKLAAGIQAETLQDVIRGVGGIWSEAFPEYVFSYEFFDENIQAFYRQEEKYANLFQLFSVIFMVIGCLGLYGLITFVVNRKEKEVAIRKVLGATLSNILMLFSQEYVRLILISFTLAAPVAWYVSREWLSSFANRIPLSWWIFMIPGAIVLLIAMMVVIVKSLNAARVNPVDKLKYD